MAEARILVVDDDRNLLELMKMRLESLGYEVTTSLTEKEAGAAMKERPFDLRLLTATEAMIGLHHGGVVPPTPIRRANLTAHGMKALRGNRRAPTPISQNLLKPRNSVSR
jgi:hypothetical protein